MKLIDKINTISDLKKLQISDLSELAKNVREMILETVSKNGGHLASSLGACDLTVALHYVFNSPKDKFVWDVGHQSYAHKILTERKNDFSSLRKLNGLSGFTKISESVHDAFGAGHASTSISASLGIAEANFHDKKKQKTIAIIGDGSMTGGLAYEGMNQAGHLKRDLIVVFNDNAMSISPNVGALASFLSRKSASGFLNRTQDEIKNMLKSIPHFGDDLVQIVKRFKTLIKGIISPGLVFECLGFRYVGPIDGHNIPLMVNMFRDISQLSCPILIHVLTKKGNGYGFAEDNPISFHGPGPFDIETGTIIKDTNGIPSYTDVFGETAIRLARIDPKVVAITAAMTTGTGLVNFSKEFPDRFYDVGIAEAHAVCFAAGLATKGYKPIVSIYSTFLQRAYDQIIHDVALQNLPVIFAIDRAGIVGNDGPTHHGTFDLSYLRCIPNMVIMSPKDENELVHMLYTATKLPNPVAIRYPRGYGLGVNINWKFKEIPLATGEVLKEDEKNNYILLIAIGHFVSEALEISKLLNEYNVPCKVINARFVKPLDKALIISSIQNAYLTYTLEENSKAGGFGSGILELAEEENILNKVHIKRIGLDDIFIEHGSQKELRKQHNLTSEEIFKNILKTYEELHKTKQIYKLKIA
jgi:1-deoxy-D-xylulose-5-phosphate synthase